MIKGDRVEIKNSHIVHANGIWELYNITDNQYHMCRIGKNGKRLKPRPENMFNPTQDQLKRFILQ